MRGITRLLFGDSGDSGDFDDDASRILDRLSGRDRERDMTERVLRSGEWCGSTPGRRTAPRPGRRGPTG